jgi:acid phosphatase (class A)
MRNHSRSIAVALALLTGSLAATSVSAQPAPCPKIEPIDLSAVLLAPPCNTCAITRAELAELRVLQTARTPATVQHATGDYTRTVERFLAGMDPPIIVDNVGAADPLFKCINEMSEDAIQAAKAKFQRTRPYKLPDNGLQTLKEIPANDSFSFPSGHANFGMVTGLVLASMVPELRERISARIEDFGLSRLISAVHFRSDVYAGELSGAAVAASLFANADFRTEVARVTPDVRKAVGY